MLWIRSPLQELRYYHPNLVSCACESAHLSSITENSSEAGRMATKRKAAAMASAEDDEPVDPSDELVFIGLGGCQEVGRSCHILQYKGKTVMVRFDTALP